MFADERLELRHDRFVAAKREVRLDPLLQRLQPQLVQTGDLGLREGLVADVVESVASPQLEGLAELSRRLGRVLGGECFASRGEELLEPMCVKFFRGEYEGIPGSSRLESFDPDDRAQARDIGPKRRLRCRGRISLPELFDQHITRGAAIPS